MVLTSLLEAVRRLHSLGIAHCAISAENALLRFENNHFEVVLTDFAMAKFGSELSAVTGGSGKKMYRAPETVEPGATYDARAADLFACGVVGYALAIGNYPWSSTIGVDKDKAFQYVLKHGVERFFKKRHIVVENGEQVTVASVLSPGFRAVLAGLLDVDPANRKDLSGIVLKMYM
eukprot:TRINITY_DN8015_c0_g1_i6.p1 TRINITY_DN8015_c0_g1~~TRINITY_DN8015_c0_g1_i6.p1  ORF type:complete len:183 (-),score=33.36 TRINITY_DN8015_c0_g1_i6:432-959(-)